MVKVIAKSTLKPGSWEKATPLYREIIQETRKEEGCIEYTLYIDVSDENKCSIVETWESKEHLDAHMKTEHFIRIIPQLGELCVAPIEISLLKEFKV